MAQDRPTIGFYAREAESYTARDMGGGGVRLEAFLARLPHGAAVLELGCGSGRDSQVMLDRGFDVTPTDGTPEIAAAAAKRLGRPVGVLPFEAIAVTERFDGIWANACLLHVPRAHLAGIIGRIFSALKSKGVFYASYKAGECDGRDRFGRYFNYPSADWLHETYLEAGWASVLIEQDDGVGYDDLPTRWLHATATKPD